MEEDSREIKSPLLNKPEIQKEFENLDKIVEQAQKRIDYQVANDPDILKAIEIVERFLRKQRRVCYGGQAINSLLPKERQFYDTKYMIPDYDFFSPSPREDSDELIEMLEKEGFTDVNKRVGVHEGTMKIFVNYIPVADISEMNAKLFRILQGRAKTVNGILFCDPDFLRMLMYLELSRPRGEVTRWKKVYERLLLLNDAYPLSNCDQKIEVPTIDYNDRETVLDFCIKHKRVIVAPEMIELFEDRINRKKLDTLVKRGGPVIFFSHQAEVDGQDIMSIFPGSRMQIVKAMTDQLFDCVIVKKKGQPTALIFQEDACHSYTLLRLDDGNEMRIATPDLYLHLYYSLLIFGKKEKDFFDTPIECLIQKLNSVIKLGRSNPSAILPSFGLRCSGRQKGIATLLREKAKRTDEEREREKRVTKKNSKTIKSKSQKPKSKSQKSKSESRRKVVG